MFLKTLLLSLEFVSFASKMRVFDGPHLALTVHFPIFVAVVGEVLTNVETIGVDPLSGMTLT